MQESKLVLSIQSRENDISPRVASGEVTLCIERGPILFLRVLVTLGRQRQSRLPSFPEFFCYFLCYESAWEHRTAEEGSAGIEETVVDANADPRFVVSCNSDSFLPLMSFPPTRLNNAAHCKLRSFHRVNDYVKKRQSSPLYTLSGIHSGTARWAPLR